MAQWEALARQHLGNLQQFAAIAQKAVQDKQLPDLIPEDVQQSLLLTACVLSGTTILLVSRTRKFILETAEAIITIILLLLLIGMVLGMPAGVIYMSYKGVVFLANSLLTNFPALQAVVNSLQGQLAAWWQSAESAIHTS